MYNLLEKDTGKKIKFTTRSHDKGAWRRSDISVEAKKRRRAFQGENSIYLHRNKEYTTFSLQATYLSGTVEWKRKEMKEVRRV